MAEVTKTVAHTPGPWEAILEETKTAIRPASTGYLIAELSPSSFTYSSGKHDIGANARLIAAAPDLIDALKAARECLLDHVPVMERGGWRMQNARDVMVQIKNAIRKAEGR